MTVHRSRGKHPLIHGERQLGNVVIGPRLRALGRAMRRVPNGRALNAQVLDGKQWDANTGLFLRPKGSGQATKEAV